MPNATAAGSRPGMKARNVVLVVATAAVALNLRPGITTVGPELDTVTRHFGAGSAAGGVITALPVIAFAVVSLATPALLARISVRAGLYAALAIIAVSLAVRPWGGLPLFVLATFVSAIGIGLLSALLPVVVRSSGSTGVLVTTFTTALQAGAALGFAAIVPLSNAVHSWQWGLTFWALLAPIGMFALWAAPGAATAQSPSALPERATVNPFTILRRTRTLWLAVFFGLQALVAFVVIGWLPSILVDDAGVGPQAAGGYLGLMTCLGVPISLIVPPFVARSAHPARWLAGFSACTVLGVLALLVAPRAAPLLWVLVLGVGLSVFSLVLTVLTVRASTAEQAAGLSSSVQGVGYLVAAVGPYAIGLFRHLGAGWALPLGALLATAVLQLVAAFAIGRGRGA
ncbi:MFS transporter [Nocardia terpenica]|uniref:MFS transporter n=1 Tax=Nocardia terpenica TaxID=455432 RepID=UPI0018946828|nr:MFS transporter [Nocardia terpenica]MBF6063352.1 MFS transporter [Nocardia terpenica]MBF6105908.1 MFS transporter [Nocardia terpenica]MBF6113508.1 MFS transporter [Nocardia terpenica]MBF6119649.1 MFS transporter [Nocardia terpenica]MBF6152060.1 MFS transporter [Nocardia terpenica]